MARHLAPQATISNTGWVSSTNAIDLAYDIDEFRADDADYIEATGGRTLIVSIPAVTVPEDTTKPYVLRWRAFAIGSGNETLVVRLYQGDTIKTTNPAQFISIAEYTNYSYTLTQAQVDSITNYTNLRLRIISSTAPFEYARVSWVEFQIPDEAAGLDERAWMTKAVLRKNPHLHPLYGESPVY